MSPTSYRAAPPRVWNTNRNTRVRRGSTMRDTAGLFVLVQIADVVRARADLRQAPRRVKRRALEKEPPLGFGQQLHVCERVLPAAQILFHEGALEFCFRVLGRNFVAF